MRKVLVAALAATLAVVVVLIAAGAFLYARNTTPAVPAIATAEAAASGSPWVVKMHAQWCPVCMLTKGMWAEIEEHYAGRVRLAVFDFTDEATTAATRAEAERLGLAGVLEEAGFATGTVLVLDGRTKDIAAWISGSRDFAEYRAAIDAALAAADSQ
jgi:thiol-disulfide isomerase/thioredoxin